MYTHTHTHTPTHTHTRTMESLGLSDNSGSWTRRVSKGYLWSMLCGLEYPLLSMIAVSQREPLLVGEGGKATSHNVSCFSGSSNKRPRRVAWLDHEASRWHCWGVQGTPMPISRPTGVDCHQFEWSIPRVGEYRRYSIWRYSRFQYLYLILDTYSDIIIKWKSNWSNQRYCPCMYLHLISPVDSNFETFKKLPRENRLRH